MKTRRHFLQSTTAIIALPALESLGFRRFASAATATAATPPKRLIFLGFGWEFVGGCATTTAANSINSRGDVTAYVASI